MNNITRVVLVAGLVGVANSLNAQTCAGNASYNAGPMRVGAGFQSTVNADQGAGMKAYGLEFGMGAQNGLYGAVSYDRWSPESGSGMNGFGVNGGWSYDMNQAKTIQVCPVAAFNYVKLPDQGGASASDHAFVFGGTIGTTMAMSSTLNFVPFAGIVRQRETVSASAAGTTFSQTESYENITLGAGFVMNRTLTIRPAFVLSAGVPSGTTIPNQFQLGFDYNFGGNSPAAAPARRR